MVANTASWFPRKHRIVRDSAGAAGGIPNFAYRTLLGPGLIRIASASLLRARRVFQRVASDTTRDIYR